MDSYQVRARSSDVVCRGTAGEAGFVVGTVLRNAIQQAQSLLGKYEAFRLLQPWWCPYPLYRFYAERYARKKLEAEMRSHFPRQAEMLEGIGMGADITRQALYLMHACELPPGGLEGHPTTRAVHAACSSAALRGDRTETGEPLIVHNFDCVGLVGDFLIIRDNSAAGRIRSLELTAAPLCGAAGGLNEAGLAVTYNSVVGTDRPRSVMPISLAVSRVLGSCVNVEQAIEMFQATPRCGGAALMLADADGDVAAVELSNTRSAVRRLLAGRHVLTHTNRYRAETMQSVQIPPDVRYGEESPAALRGMRVMESPEQREARLKQLLASREQHSPESLAAIMEDHGPSEEPSPDTLCMHHEYWSTAATLQLLPARRTLRVAFGQACQTELREYSFSGGNELDSDGNKSDGNDNAR